MNTTTQSTHSDTVTSLRGEDSQKSRPPMRIADFRDAVDTLNWNRNDLSGATREEFKRMDVATRLNRYIAEVEKALPYVHPRFTLDLEYARMSIESARVVIEGWKRLER